MFVIKGVLNMLKSEKVKTEIIRVLIKVFFLQNHRIYIYNSEEVQQE